MSKVVHHQPLHQRQPIAVVDDALEVTIQHQHHHRTMCILPLRQISLLTPHPGVDMAMARARNVVVIGLRVGQMVLDQVMVWPHWTFQVVLKFAMSILNAKVSTSSMLLACALTTGLEASVCMNRKVMTATGSLALTHRQHLHLW